MWSWRRSLEYCYIQEINILALLHDFFLGERGQCRLLACADLEFRSWINLCLISLLLTDRANWTSVVSFLFVRLGHWPFFHSFFFFVWYFQAVIFMLDWKRYQAYSSLVDVFWHLAEKEKRYDGMVYISRIDGQNVEVFTRHSTYQWHDFALPRKFIHLEETRSLHIKHCIQIKFPFQWNCCQCTLRCMQIESILWDETSE